MMPKTLIGIFTSVAVILALCPDPGWSQQQYMTRGQLWVETFNVGHGAFRYEERKICGSLGLMYPGSSGGVGGGCVDENAFMDFWGIRQENDTAYNTSLAESFWILSKEENPVFAPETPADQRPVPRHQISMRGPSFGPPKGMGGGPLHVSYHMAREKDLGRETGRLHTYWPGTPYVDEFGKPTRNVFIANFSPGEYPTDGFAEEIRIRSFGNGIGLTGIARTMLWSYQDWDDFVIDEIIITNTSRDSIDDEGKHGVQPGWDHHAQGQLCRDDLRRGLSGVRERVRGLRGRALLDPSGRLWRPSSSSCRRPLQVYGCAELRRAVRSMQAERSPTSGTGTCR